MNFEVSAEALKAASAFCLSAIERKQTLPILGNFLIEAKGNQVTFTGTDLKKENKISFEASVKEEGSITVPAIKLDKCIKATGADGNFKFGVNSKQEYILSQGRKRWKLNTLPAKEYPSFDSSAKGEPLELNVPVSDLADAMTKCSPMMGRSDARHYLNGVLFDIEPDRLSVVATDGHRLGMYKIGVSQAQQRQAIIPATAVSDIIKLIGKSDNASIVIDDTNVSFTCGDKKITSKLIDGRYPNYKQVIPKPSKHIAVTTSEFFDSVKVVLALANEKYRGISLTFGDELKLEANNVERDSSEDVINCNYTGEAFSVGFNGDYLVDAMSPVASENTTLGIDDRGNKRLLIKDGSYEAVVMEMRM